MIIGLIESEITSINYTFSNLRESYRLDISIYKDEPP